MLNSNHILIRSLVVADGKRNECKSYLASSYRHICGNMKSMDRSKLYEIFSFSTVLRSFAIRNNPEHFICIFRIGAVCSNDTALAALSSLWSLFTAWRVWLRVAGIWQHFDEYIASALLLFACGDHHIICCASRHGVLVYCVLRAFYLLFILISLSHFSTIFCTFERSKINLFGSHSAHRAFTQLTCSPVCSRPARQRAEWNSISRTLRISV